MKYYINYNVLITIILLFAVIYFLSYFKEAPVFNEHYKNNVDYNQPNPFLDTNKKDSVIYSHLDKLSNVKLETKAFEANNYPCSPGYIVQSTDFWGQPIGRFKRNTC